MFNWLVTLFMIASIIILFAAWTRAIRAKDMMAAPNALKRWSALRLMIFLALCYQVFLLILALVGLKTLFAYFGGLYILYFNVVAFYLVSFFIHAMGACGCCEPKKGSKS